MKKLSLILLLLTICSGVMAASSEKISLLADKSVYEIDLEGPTYEAVTEDYSYIGTCYEEREYVEKFCGDKVPVGATRTADGCFYVSLVRDFAYDCEQWSTRRVAVEDGGLSRASIQVKLENANLLTNSIGLSLSLLQNLSSLGKEVAFSFHHQKNTNILILDESAKQKNGEYEGDIYIFKRDYSFKVVNAPAAESIMGEGPSIVDIDTEFLTVSLPAITENIDRLSMEIEILKKGFINFNLKGKFTKNLREFSAEEVKGKMIVKIPFSELPYLDKRKSKRYLVTARVYMDTKSIVFPYINRSSPEATQVFKASFKRNGSIEITK